MSEQEGIFDLVLCGGRVIDPETKLDAPRDVAIHEGRIVKLGAPGTLANQSREAVDVSGFVLCPGFIDTHSHGSGHKESAILAAFDGVTTHLELEFGAYPVGPWYEHRKGQSLIHFGASVGHIPARVCAMEPDLQRAHSTPHLLADCMCTCSATHMLQCLTDRDSNLMCALEEGLTDGGLGIGMGIAYTSAADHREIYRIFELAARHGVCVYVHNRGDMRQLSDMHELFADAAATGAALQVCHIASSCGKNVDLPLTLEMIDRLNERGIDVTCEQYPYTAGMTRIDSGVFKPGWQERLGIGPESVEWAATNERLTDESFAERQREGGVVVIHSIPDESVDLCMSHPRCMIASDGIPFGPGGAHPRGAGCFTRVLAEYVRKRSVISLTEAIRKMTLMPAQRMEAFSEAFSRKGRIQEGCDADICILSPDTVQDHATYSKPATRSTGVKHLIVNGTFVIRNGELCEGVAPGQGMRASLQRCGFC